MATGSFCAVLANYVAGLGGEVGLRERDLRTNTARCRNLPQLLLLTVLHDPAQDWPP